MKTRNNLPLLLNELKLTGEGVEVGVQEGIYSEHLLKYSDLSVLHSIDCWQHHTGYKDIANKNNLKQLLYYYKTKIRLKKYKERSNIIKGYSHSVVHQFTNKSLDFVYLDADHSYEGVKLDLSVWYPKIRTGGVLAGHDYLNGELPEGVFGVKKAVDEFIKKHDLKLHVTEEEKWPTWYIIV